MPGAGRGHDLWVKLARALQNRKIAVGARGKGSRTLKKELNEKAMNDRVECVFAMGWVDDGRFQKHGTGHWRAGHDEFDDQLKEIMGGELVQEAKGFSALMAATRG
ncbi:hypothetical protein RRG08_063271 [Elysia crispata]|uniref:Uncharacterized protein n=1 Tax=Elysia crispata TaxID=231223 RepID=A0AAE0XPJ4_9GAST|nr:hypothetical protein RRG08_063271 [Elysia crispata]